MLRLIPVVEIAPFRFSERERPVGGIEPYGPVTRQEWNAYLDACRRDAGFDDLDPIAPRSFMVPIEQLTPTHLRLVIEDHLNALDWSADDPRDIGEFLCPLDGGLAIELEGEIVSEPGCCGDLGSLQEWILLSEQRPGLYLDIWNGHDTSRIEGRYRTDADVFEVRITPFEVTPAQDMPTSESARVRNVEISLASNELEGVVHTARNLAVHALPAAAKVIPAPTPRRQNEIARKLFGVG